MKNKKNVIWVLGAVCAVILFVGVIFLYHHLREEYKPDSLTKVDSGEQSKSDEVSDDLGEENRAGDADEETSNEKGSQEDASAYIAPDFMVYDTEGNEVKLSDYKGKPVVLNFWATWCYYCKKEMPDFNAVYKQYPEVQFLMVNATDGIQETEEAARAYVEEQGFEFPVFYDKEQQAVYAYQVSGLPATFFIDASGNLVTYATGMLDKSTLEQGIEMLIEDSKMS